MLKIGLTGGIACGKSYTLRRFRGLGAATIDADQIARDVVEPGHPALTEIVAAFGREMLRPDGHLDRTRMGSLIFSDPQQRERLNRIIHPYILAEEQRLIARIESERARCPLIIVDAALMIEAGSHSRYDLLVVVYCRPEVQLQRLQLRDSLDRQAALQRVNSQMPALEKVRLADYVIETSGKLSETDEQVKQIFLEMIQRSEQEREPPPPPPVTE